MKQFPIPSGPPRDDRDRPGVPSPKATDDDDTQGSYLPDTVDNSDAATGSYAKGGMVKVAHYAEGGPVFGRSQSFLKTPNEFTPAKPAANPNSVPQAYGKGGKGKAPPDKTPKGNWKGHQ